MFGHLCRGRHHLTARFPEAIHIAAKPAATIGTDQP